MFWLPVRPQQSDWRAWLRELGGILEKNWDEGVDPVRARELALVALEAQRACVVVDGAESWQGAEEWLEMCASFLSAASLVVISDRPLPLSPRRRIESTCIQLGPLSLEESRELLRELACEADPAAAAGVPLVLHCLARGIRLESPDLSEDLQLMALTPSGWPMTEFGPADAWLERRGDTLHLHPVLATQVSLHWGPAQRRALHERALQRLSAEGCAATLRARLDHLLGLERLDEARALLESHAPEWLRAGEFSSVASLVTRVLAHGARWAPGYALRAQAYAGAGQLELALGDLGAALARADSAWEVRALNDRCHLWLDLGRIDEAERDARRCLTLCRRLPPPQPGFIKALNGLARVWNLRGQGSGAERYAREALELALQWKNDRGEAYSRFILAQSMLEQERWQECLDWSLPAVDLARQVGEIRLTFLARFWAGAALLRLGRLQSAAELLEQTWRDSRAFPDRKMRVLAELMQAQQLQLRGQQDQARLHLAAGQQQAEECGYGLLGMQALLVRELVESDPRWRKQAWDLARHHGTRLSSWSAPAADGRYRLLTPRGVEDCSGEQLTGRLAESDLWLDVPGEKLWDRQTGEISLRGKKLWLRMLTVLLSRPGRAFSVEELYRAVWDVPFEGAASAAQVRKQVSGLRALLGQRFLERGEWGGYCFRPPERWAVLEGS